MKANLLSFIKKASLHAFVGLGALILIIGGGLVLWAASFTLPDFGSFNERKVFQSTKIYDKTGEVMLYNLSEDIRRTVISSDEMSRHIKNATVAIEDREFYQHHGIRIRSIIRAFLANLEAGEVVQGGSTITQQVVKNTLLTTDKKISRKIKEAFLAIRLEQKYTKDQILELYLNEAPYGGTIYGIEEASQAFFGKPAKDLTLPESAYLAALPQAPTYYSPYGNHQDDLISRKNLVLERMTDLGFITKEEALDAKSAEVTFIPREERNIKAPHFVMYVREYLEKKYGVDMVETGGLRVVTSLDWKMQQKAEEIVAQYGAENEERFNAKNAAMVATDPKTGQILVMVGSKDYFDVENQGNFNVALAKRQPGSSFKPVVYAAGFNRGYTPDTILFDLPTQFSVTCDAYGVPKYGDSSSCYMPVNYDDKYRGPMTIRNALAQSINVPAVKMLYLVGMQDAISMARSLGITSLTTPDRYGLTLVLGGGEVTLLELTGAYGVFANDGVRTPLTGIIKIEDRSGNILEEFKPSPEQSIPAEVARKISDILSDNNARTPAFGASSPLFFEGRSVAAKTGTTNDYKDTWIIGYTPSISVGTWVGNNDNTPMEKKVAGYIVAPMWHAFMEEVLPEIPDENFVSPEPTPLDIKPVLRGIWQGGIVNESGTGKLSVSGGVHSILHWVDKDDPLGPVPNNPRIDPQYELWETPVLSWIATNGAIVTQSTQSLISNSVSNNVQPPSGPIWFSAPNQSNIWGRSDKITITVRHEDNLSFDKIDFYINETHIGSKTKTPYTITIVPNEVLSPSQTDGLILRAILKNQTEQKEISQPIIFSR